MIIMFLINKKNLKIRMKWSINLGFCVTWCGQNSFTLSLNAWAKVFWNLIGNSCLETRLLRCSSDDGDGVEDGWGANGQEACDVRKDICVGLLHSTSTLTFMCWKVTECLYIRFCFLFLCTCISVSQLYLGHQIYIVGYTKCLLMFSILFRIVIHAIKVNDGINKHS